MSYMTERSHNIPKNWRAIRAGSTRTFSGEVILNAPDYEVIQFRNQATRRSKLDGSFGPLPIANEELYSNNGHHKEESPLEAGILYQAKEEVTSYP